MAGKKNGPVSARERARAAKAKLDADRAARDKRIEEQATEWYRLDDTIEQAQATITDARTQQAEVVGKLGDEDVTVDDAAALLGIEPAEVRALRKQHRKAAKDQQPAPTVVTADTRVDRDPEPAEPVAS